MDPYSYLLLDVFTTAPLLGNPLAVFTDAHHISDDDMQKIAGELNLPETVFLTKMGNTAFRARIFTPQRELDFAGHPTIGSAYAIAHLTKQPKFTIEENVGPIPIETTVDAEGNTMFWLTTPPISFLQFAESALCARLLGLMHSDLLPIRPQYVSAGSPLLFVGLRTVEAVDRAAINTQYLSDSLGTVDSVGTFFFARKEPNSKRCFDVYARMFAPQIGIPEDAATAGATGPLAAYMMHSGTFRMDPPCEFTSEQGTKMGRRSILHVSIDGSKEKPRIRVGGSVVTVAEGSFFLNGRP